MNKKIVVETHGAGYKAYLHGNAGTWEAGATVAEAVGKLVTSCSEELGIQLDLDQASRRPAVH